MELFRTWGPAILAVFLIRTFIFEPFNIPSKSMVPTLLIGDYVVVNRSSYGLWVPATLVDLNIIPGVDSLGIPPRWEVFDWGDPERGDIIVFRYPVDPEINFIKRVVGLPGDVIEVTDNQITVNGVKQERKKLGKYQYELKSCGTETLDLYEEDLGEMTLTKLLDPYRQAELSEFPSQKARKRRMHIVPEGHVFVMGDNREHSLDSRSWGFVSEEMIKGKAHFIVMSWDSCKPLAEKIRGERLFQSLYNLVEPNVPAEKPRAVAPKPEPKQVEPQPTAVPTTEEPPAAASPE
jgi:signal peptidase I